MRKSTVVLSCVLFATAIAATWFWQQWKEQRQINTALQDRITVLEYQDPQISLPALLPESARPEVPAVMPTSTSNRTQPATPELPPGFRSSMEFRLWKDPEFRTALRSQHRLILEEKYRDLPDFLDLSAEQADRLLDLLAEQQLRVFDAMGQTPEERRNSTDFMQEMQARNEAEITDLLGASNAIRLQEFRSTLESRAEVDSVRNELARGSEPLRQNQVDPLLAVVNTELQRLNQEVSDLRKAATGSGAEANARRIELTVAANQRILDASRSILTSTQLAGLENLYRRQRTQMEAEGTMNRLRAEVAASEASGNVPR